MSPRLEVTGIVERSKREGQVRGERLQVRGAGDQVRTKSGGEPRHPLHHHQPCDQWGKRFVHSLCICGNNLNADLIFFATWIHHVFCLYHFI